ncbi:Na/Pi cotransporter family protein [bacterium]|nr:Na/Pi cotransporter family protein [bacterium]
MIQQIFEIIGGLGIFFFGMKIMSEAIQRLAGTRLRMSLSFMTQNRFMGVMTGFLVTAIIQSSSATTVMIISFINAGLLTLTESIGLIMGANLGTTVTVWIVSLLGFKFKITALALPIIGVGIPFIFSKKNQWYDVGEFLIGFGLLFLGLSFMKQGVPDIKNNPEILKFLVQYTDMGFLSFLLFILVGTALAGIIQSSSAVGAITVTMAFQGWIDFQTGVAIMLGGNVGTTVTAYLASIGANVYGKQTARAHLLFNVFGVLWVLILYIPLMKLLSLAPISDETSRTDITLYISAFHTLFNFFNIVILIAFVPQFARLVEKLVPVKKTDMDDEGPKYQLSFLNTGIVSTPEMYVFEARKEIIKMAILAHNMFQTFLDVFFHPNNKMGNSVEELKKQEDLSDKMKDELTKYLAKISRLNMAEAGALRVTSLMRIVNEIESIADCCYELIQATQKRYDEKMELHPTVNDEIRDFSIDVVDFMLFNIENLQDARLSDEELRRAIEYEIKIDDARDLLRENSVQRISEGGKVKDEMLFMEIIKNFERIGDYSLNIAESIKKMVY